MSGVQLKTIADYQAAIQKLDRNKPADRAKIAEYSQKIGELLQGQGKVDTQRGELNIYEGQQFNYNSNIADNDKIAQLNEFNKNAIVNGQKQGSKAAHQNVKDKFGSDFDEAAYKAKKEELKTAEKQLKKLDKESKNIKFDQNNPAAFNTAQKEIQTKLAEQRRVVANLTAELNDLEVDKTGASKKFAKKYEKAARKNVEQYEKTQDVVETFLDKSQAKAWEKEHPGQKAAVVNENDLRALTTLYFKGIDEIEKADADLEVAKQSGNENAIKEAENKARQIHDKYDDYAGIFEKDDKGEPQFNRINTRKVQNILVDKSGGDQNFNLDEVKVMSDDLNMKKGQIKHLAKTFGFGTESQTGAKLKAAGIAAGSALAGEVIGGLFKTKHSHQKAEAVSEAKGETKVLETLDVASSGEVFYHYLEAQGGDAFAHAVAEACAKYVPGIGLAAAPVLAGLSAFLLTKGATEDVFGGANVEKVLDNIQVADKNAQPVLKEIKEMNITGDPKRDNLIKAAVLKATQGEDSKAMNLRELQSALVDLEKTKDAIGKLPVQEEAPVPPEQPVEPKKPNLDIEHEEKHEQVQVRTELPRLKFREGTYYTSHGYIGDDGKELTPAERKQVQAELKKAENMIAYVDTNGDGVANAKDKKISLPNEITLPNGKKVKLADDAYTRIMKLPASGGGKNGKYTNAVVVMDKTTHQYYVIDKDNNNQRLAGPYNNKQDAINKKTELETPKEEK